MNRGAHLLSVFAIQYTAERELGSDRVKIVRPPEGLRQRCRVTTKAFNPESTLVVPTAFCRAPFPTPEETQTRSFVVHAVTSARG